MGIWRVRNKALSALRKDLKQENEVLEECFVVLDKCIEYLHWYVKNDKHVETFAFYCCSTLVKIRRLALGCYSLCLDDLALEAGALMRALIEGWQVLVYFRVEPSRVALAAAEKMPSAGIIAQAIDDELHNDIKDGLWQLRQHYNQVSSHFSLKTNALMPIQTDFNSEKLKTDMRSLFMVIGQVISEAVLCISVSGSKDVILRDGVQSLLEKGYSVFGPYEEPE